MIKLLMLFITLFFFAGCTKNVKMIDYKESVRPMKTGSYEIISETEGLSSAFKTLFFFGSGDPSVEKAEDSAISKEAADNVIGASYYEEDIYFLLGRVKAYYVKGKAVKYK